MREYDKQTAESVILQLDAAGKLFPQFEFSKQNNELVFLGEGGFSTVYEMVNRERKELKYALKVIGFGKHTISSSEFWDTGKIQWILCQESEYVARVLDARELQVVLNEQGELLEVKDVTKERWEDDGEGLVLQFILMEKLDPIIEKDRFGKVFLCRRELKEETEILKLAFEVGEALMAAHRNNVLHRDVKLENIFRDSGIEKYKLGDFGIARFAENGNAETIVYTDGYGAPEIERRLHDSYNATADIYSFGITLYLLLNDLKFPGSEGYYPKAEVQYDPDYIFPAPVNASAEVAGIIRKMCSFRAEDRYQNVGDALYALSEAAAHKLSEVPEEIVDMVTETYHEETTDHEKTGDTPARPKTRAERKEEQRLADEEYRSGSIWYGLFMTFTMGLLFMSMKGDTQLSGNLLLFALPVIVLFEALFQRLGEFQLASGIISLGLIGLSACSTGLSVIHLLLALIVILGSPVIIASGAIAAGIWIWLEISGKMPFESFFSGHDLLWIFLILLFILIESYINFCNEAGRIDENNLYVAMIILDLLFPVMILTGIVLLILQHFEVLGINETVNSLHLVRTGIISLGIRIVFVSLEDEEEDDNEQIISGEGKAQNEINKLDDWRN